MNLLKSITLICFSAACVFSVCEKVNTFAHQKAFETHLIEKKLAVEARKTKLDDYYAKQFLHYIKTLDKAKGDSIKETVCFELIEKLEDLMATDGYDRAEIDEIKYKLIGEEDLTKLNFFQAEPHTQASQCKCSSSSCSCAGK
jgi:hypothetical protein